MMGSIDISRHPSRLPDSFAHSQKPTLFADFVSFLGEVLRASPFLPLLLPSCYLPATSAALCGPLRPSAAHYQSLVALPMYQSQASLGKGFLGAFCTAAAAKLEARREGTSFR